MLAARSFADRNRYEVDADRELAALGASNLAAALAQGFTVTGTSSRTAINSLSSVITGCRSSSAALCMPGKGDAP